MRRLLCPVFGALLLVGGIGLSGAGPANAAPSAVQQATALHSAVTAMLTGYLRAYGSDLPASDRARVTALITRAEVSLDRLDSAVRAIPAARTVRAHRAAIEVALTRQAEARAAATDGMAEVTPLLASRMGLVELLGAKRDGDRLLDQLDSLGSAIRRA